MIVRLKSYFNYICCMDGWVCVLVLVIASPNLLPPSLLLQIGKILNPIKTVFSC